MDDRTTYFAHTEKASTINTAIDAWVVRQQLKRKLDFRFVVWAFLGFFALYLDRSNLPNAYVSGMKEDLELESAVYNWAGTVMNIGFTVFQILGSLILPRIYPRWFLPTMAVAWGTVQCCMAFVTNHQGLLALRFCLGFCQSIFQPALVYLLGSWYTDTQVAKRVSLYRAALGVSSAVGGLIAGGIVQTMEDRAGLGAWQWLFVVEGLISVFVGLLGYMMVPNYPHQKTSWISEYEQKVTMDQQALHDVALSVTPYDWMTQVSLFKDVIAAPYVWLLTATAVCAMFLMQFGMFFVIILTDMGYDSAFANYMSTPKNLFGSIFGYAVGWSSDWFGERAIHLTLLNIWGTLWSIVLAAVNRGHNPASLVFVAAYALTMMQPVLALAFVWALIIYKRNPNSRALAVAIVSSLAQLIPAFLGVKLWIVTDSPAFWLGKITNVAFGGIATLAILLVWFLLRIEFRLPTPRLQEQHSEETPSKDGRQRVEFVNV